ncbi:MAG: 50S ribosomal protein L11 methyltransferase [Chromatiaceae bacterium]
MAKTTGYSVLSYGDMITDRPRMGPYVEALRQAVRPGCVVLDIGAGTGIYSLLACQLGAGEVHAVEPNAAIEVARQAAAANGYADRIRFHPALSTNVTLPRPADVIVSDLRGVLPLLQQHIPAIADARRRLLAPGGVLIPRRDRLWAALIEDAKTYRPYAKPWLDNEYGLDLRAGHRLVVNTWRKVNATVDQLLVAPQAWATLDYASVENPNVAGALSWRAERHGTAHGVLVWFDAELAEGIGFSNAPGQPELIYGQAFFPLQEPVLMEGGDLVEISLRADLIDDDYVWRWDTRVSAAADGGQTKASFRQSTFYGAPLSVEGLKRREAGYTPPRSEAGEIDQYVLSLIDGRRNLSEIVEHLVARFPHRFPRRQDAPTRAADVAQRYSQPD